MACQAGLRGGVSNGFAGDGACTPDAARSPPGGKSLSRACRARLALMALLVSGCAVERVRASDDRLDPAGLQALEPGQLEMIRVDPIPVPLPGRQDTMAPLRSSGTGCRIRPGWRAAVLEAVQSARPSAAPPEGARAQFHLWLARRDGATFLATFEEPPAGGAASAVPVLVEGAWTLMPGHSYAIVRRALSASGCRFTP